MTMPGQDRRLFLFGLAAATASAPALAQTSPGPASGGTPSPALIEDLVLANHILVQQGVLDAFGHVSARHDKDPQRFLLSRSLAPEQVTAADIMEYDFDGTPVDARGRTSYVERFIHGAIYRARPDVNGIVHSHSPAVIPFSVSSEPLRAVSTMAGYLGTSVPVFEMRDQFGSSTDMLVRDPKIGAALAKTLDQRMVVLMRGHGFVAVGGTVRLATMHAYYTEFNARIQADAMKLGKVTYLTEGEAAKTWQDNQVERAWSVWREKALAVQPK